MTLSQILTILLILAHLPVWLYLSQGFLHLALSLLVRKRKDKAVADRESNDFALIITAHEDTDFIPPIIDSILKQSYSKYHAYVVADNCDITNISNLENDKVTILNPEEALNSKVKSIDHAISCFRRDHSYMIIFDPDNLLHTDYLKELDNYITTESYRMVQTRLLPKNVDSTIAQLDALGSSYYDFISRESKNDLGLSSHIYGLGIAINTEVYKEIKYKNVVGGFDKRMQLDVLKAGYKIGYCRKAVVYDEKTSNPKELEKQRTRWLHSYFKYSKDGFGILWRGISGMKFDWIYFGIESIRPPIVVLMLAYLALGIADILFVPSLLYPWIGFIALFLISVLLIIWRPRENRSYMASILYVPKFLFILIISLLGLKKAKRQFLKTQHNKLIYIDDILNKGQA